MRNQCSTLSLNGNGVKGLVDSGLTEVPGPFIQPPHLRLIKKKHVSTWSAESLTIIDLSELDSPNHDQVFNAIVHASETLGFLQIVNHGVPLEVLESLKVATHHFFNQPTEKKAVYLEGVNPSSMIKYGSSFSRDNENILKWKDYVSMTYTNHDDAIQFWPNQCKLESFLLSY